jgi:hypothetical protein
MPLPPIAALPPRAEEARAWARATLNGRPEGASFNLKLRGVCVFVNTDGSIDVPAATSSSMAMGGMFDDMAPNDALTAAGFWLGVADLLVMDEAEAEPLPVAPAPVFSEASFATQTGEG